MFLSNLQLVKFAVPPVISTAPPLEPEEFDVKNGRSEKCRVNDAMTFYAVKSQNGSIGKFGEQYCPEHSVYHKKGGFAELFIF